MKIITKLDRAKFSIEEDTIADPPLILDFNPLLVGLSGNFCLVHWQARPKNFREWGVYDGFKDTYFSLAKIDIFSRSTTFQLKDNVTSTLPSSVLYFPNSALSLSGRTGTIAPLVLN